MPFLGLLVLMGLIGTSCQKSEVAPGASELKKERHMNAARTLAKRLPKITIYDDKTKRSLRITTDGFSFTENAENGFNFSDPRGITYTNSATGGQYVVAAQGFGMNAGGGGGGLIQIGSTSMNIKYTFCFTADQEFFGANLFSQGNESLFDGVSGVIGVDGDFAQLQNGNGGDTDIEDLFSGLGMYIVYAKRAQGNYPILNWVNLVENSNSEPNPNAIKNKGFAFFIDFKHKKLYFSHSGNLSVSGGSITFTGKYFAFDPENEDAGYQLVDGLGTMGCN